MQRRAEVHGRLETRGERNETTDVGLCESGRLVVVLRHEVGIFDPETEAFKAIATIEPDRTDTPHGRLTLPTSSGLENLWMPPWSQQSA